MRIAIISTTTYATPPTAYGGEAFFYHLSKGLCELEAEVTLYGAPGSKLPHPNCRCRLRLLLGTYGEIDPSREYLALQWYKDEILKHDIIIDCSHNHFIAEEVGWYYQKDQERVITVLNGVTSNTPRCGPYNTIVGSQKWKQLLLMGRTQFYGTVMEEKYGGSLERSVPEVDIAGVVPWATDTAFYAPGERASNPPYFLWMSRPTDYKGLADALRLVGETKATLVIAPGLGNASHHKELEVYKPEIAAAKAAGAEIEIVYLPLDSRHHKLKRQLLQEATALLYPIQCHEPFGLVVVEALSCGTPVITYQLGAMPEILTHGVTGFLARDYDDMLNYLPRVKELSPEACRKDAIERWGYCRAAADYLKIIKA